MEPRHTFDTVAEEYDARRPAYPAALVDTVVVRLPPEPRLLEVGCGTGKATRAYVQRGLEVLCLEPGGNLAAIARRNLGVEVLATDFEDWEAQPDAFDLVFSAQAWHHVDPAVGYRKAADVLKAGGTFALYANTAVANFAEGQTAYRDWWPGYKGEPLPPIEERIAAARRSIEDSGCFANLKTHRFPWTGRYTADEYVALLDTYSDHILLPPDAKRGFHAAMRVCIERIGGVCEREYEAVLHLAVPVKSVARP